MDDFRNLHGKVARTVEEVGAEALLGELGDEVDARAKDLEMYAGSTVPPPGYSLETEVEGILRTAVDAGFETFHLVGYSAGGASSVAFASRYPERLRSLALMEPACPDGKASHPKKLPFSIDSGRSRVWPRIGSCPSLSERNSPTA